MGHPANAGGGDRRAGKRGQQHATERVPKRGAVAGGKRLARELRVAVVTFDTFDLAVLELNKGHWLRFPSCAGLARIVFDDEQRLAGGPGHLGGAVERVLHLPLEHAVHTPRLLLLAKLQRKVGDLAPALLVHARWRRTLFECALREALLAFEEELHALTTADAADGAGVSRH